MSVPAEQRRNRWRAILGEVDHHLGLDLLIFLSGELQVQNLAQGQAIGAGGWECAANSVP